MSKRLCKKNLPILFLVSILFALSIDLRHSINQIKARHGSKATTINKQETENENKYVNIPKKLLDQNQLKYSIDSWKSVERKDSYNNELQFYSKDNVVIKEDTIEIISKKETKEDKMYTSGLVESTNVYKYGHFEFDIKISEGKGLFPAIWFLPIKGGHLPEIDLFEMIGSEPYIFYGVIHFKDNGQQDSDYFAYKVPIKDQYTVSLEWKKESLTWYIDNKEVYTTTKGVPQEYMYIIINQAIGGDWPGNPDSNTVFPNRFKILSTRIHSVYKKGRN